MRKWDEGICAFSSHGQNTILAQDIFLSTGCFGDFIRHAKKKKYAGNFKSKRLADNFHTKDSLLWWQQSIIILHNVARLETVMTSH